jgi:hypothetical protein
MAHGSLLDKGFQLSNQTRTGRSSENRNGSGSHLFKSFHS